MAYTWTVLTNQLTNYLEEENSADFTTALPQIVSDAELRIYRDLDFLATRGQNHSLTFTAGQRTLSLAGITGATIGGYPVAYAYPVVVQGITACTPVNTAPPTTTRVRFQPATLDFIDMIWPDEATTQAPGVQSGFFALVDHERVVVAPTPDQAYTVEVTGTWRPAPMSSTQAQSWLGDNVPDLLFAACMVEGAAYQRDFGSMSDDPQKALSWNAHYDALKANATEEEQRRKSQGMGWLPFGAAPVAGTQRT